MLFLSEMGIFSMNVILKICFYLIYEEFGN